ncbi:hypothetical protein [Streptomyces sp. NPDC055912]|uniref:hypothetical protein n=1 Tax=Streptomyces sp. NPDC055912 TaxID=3345660 RepID=UPI0035D88DF1
MSSTVTPSPTHACPHRSCAFLHGVVLLLLAPALIAAVVFGGLTMWLLLAFLGLIQLGIVLLPQALTPAAPPSTRPLAVRPVWAFLAVVVDFLHFLAALAFLAAVAIDRSYAAVPPPTVGGYSALGAVGALFVLHRVTHHMATSPADHD